MKRKIYIPTLLAIGIIGGVNVHHHCSSQTESNLLAENIEAVCGGEDDYILVPLEDGPCYKQELSGYTKTENGALMHELIWMPHGTWKTCTSRERASYEIWDMCTPKPCKDGSKKYKTGELPTPPKEWI